MKKKCEIIKEIIQIYIIAVMILQLLQITKVIPDENNINIVMLLVGVILYAITFINERYCYNWVQIAFVLSTIVTIVLNFNIETIKSVAYEIFYIIVLYGLAQRFVDIKIYTIILKIIVIANTIFIAVFGTMYFVQGFTINKNEFFNIFFYNINNGALLAFTSILATNYLYKINKMKLLLFILLNICNIAFIMVSEARTAILLLIAFMVVSICSVFIRRINIEKIAKKIKCLFIIMLVAVLIPLSLIILKENYNMNLDKDKKIYEFENMLTEISSLRYPLWKYSIQAMKQSPIFGIGAIIGERTIEKVPEYLIKQKFSAHQVTILSRNNLHNGYIQVLVQHGIVGIILLIGFIYGQIKKIYNVKAKNAFMWYLKYFFLFIIIANLFENNLILSNSFIVYLIWITIGVSSNIKGKITVGGKHAKS